MTAKLNTVKLPRALVAVIIALFSLIETLSLSVALAGDTYTTYALVSNPKQGKSYVIITSNTSGNGGYTIDYEGKGSTKGDGDFKEGSVYINAASGSFTAPYINYNDDKDSNTHHVMTIEGTGTSFKIICSRKGDYLSVSGTGSLGRSSSGTTYTYTNNYLMVDSSYLYLSGSSYKLTTDINQATKFYFYEKGSTGDVAPSSSLSASPTSMSLEVGGGNGSATVTPSNCSINTVNSGNANVATVSRSGNNLTITPIGPGTTTITITGTANSGYTAPESRTIDVTVTAPYYAQLIYDANGGSNTPAPQNNSAKSSSTSASVPFTVTSSQPTRSGYTFLGWSATQTATSPSYYAGSSYNITSTSRTSANPVPKTLYAVWEKEKPLGDTSKAEITKPSTESTGSSYGKPYLKKELIKNSDGTYSIRLTGRATEQVSIATQLYVTDGWNKDYSYSDLNSGKYYYYYNGTLYPVKATTYTYDGNTYYVGYITVGSTTYYLDSKLTSNQSDKPGKKNSTSKVYSTANSLSDYDSDGKNAPLYVVTTSYSAPGEYATSRGSTAITYKNAKSGGYYYKYGNQFYELTEYKSSKKYYIKFSVNGNTYYLTSSGGTTTNTSSAVYSNSETETIATLTLYNPPVRVVAGSGGTAQALTSAAVLKDTINTSLFDLSSATATVTKGSANTPGLNKTSGLVTATGYNYGSNVGQDFVVTISGLKLKDQYAGTYDSNTDNAGIYASSSDSTPIVQVGSPQITIPEKQSTPTYTVTWLNGDGDTLDETEVEEGSAIPTTNKTPTKDATAQYTYTFKEWKLKSGDASNGTVDSDLVYEPVFTENLRSYPVSWYNDDGTLIENVVYNYGDTPSHVAPTKADDDNYTYTFKGWATTKDGTPLATLPDVTGNASYHAVFEASEKEKSYSLEASDITYIRYKGAEGLTGATYEAGYAKLIFTLYENGNAQTQSTDKYYYEYEIDDTSIVDQFKYNGNYIENDWYLTLQDEKGGKTTVTMYVYENAGSSRSSSEKGKFLASTTFTVTVNPCTITWNVDGTETTTSANVGDSPVSGLTPTKSGYTFKGWATEPNGTPVAEKDLDKVSGNTTYYAIFEKDAVYTMTVADVVYNKTTDTVTLSELSGGYEGQTFTLKEDWCVGFYPRFVIRDEKGIDITPSNPNYHGFTYEVISGNDLVDSYDYANVLLDESKTGEAVLKVTYTDKIDGKDISVSTTFNVQIIEDFIPETDASTDKKLLPAVTLLAVLATIATSAVLAADPRRRRRDEE